MSSTIELNDWIFIDRENDKSEMVHVKAKGRIRLNKNCVIQIGDLVGIPLNVKFYIDGDQLQPVRIDNVLLEDKEAELDDVGDNRTIGLEKSQEVQTHTSDDITAMQNEGVSGTEIIDRLKEGSSTFESKGVYSQAKWTRRALAKHRQTFTFRRHTINTLVQWEFAKQPDKICHLQADSLGQILQHASVMPGRKVMVVDQAFGLVQAAAMYKMHIPDEGIADGLFTNVYVGTRKQTSEFRQALNLADPKLYGTHNGRPTRAQTTDHSLEPDLTRGVHDVTLQAIIECEATDDLSQDVRPLLEAGYESLIIVGDADPTPTLAIMLPYVAGGGTVVVYHTSLSALQTTADYFARERAVFGGSIIQTQQLSHQVLPARTHPAMTMQVMPSYIYVAYRSEREVARAGVVG